jgi:hypothetical protein
MKIDSSSSENLDNRGAARGQVKQRPHPGAIGNHWIKMSPEQLPNGFAPVSLSVTTYLDIARDSRDEWFFIR